jgi:hypothetical protein
MGGGDQKHPTFSKLGPENYLDQDWAWADNYNYKIQLHFLDRGNYINNLIT